MNIESVALRHMKQADDVHRVFRKEIFARNGEAAILHRKAANDFLAAKRLHEAADGGLLLSLLLFQHRAEDAGEVAYILGDEEVMLHEALNGFQAAMALITKALCHFGLNVEADALFRAAREEVQLAAHRPEKILRLAEGLIFLAREDAHLHQI